MADFRSRRRRRSRRRETSAAANVAARRETSGRVGGCSEFSRIQLLVAVLLMPLLGFLMAQSTFSQDANQPWIETLPPETAASILWHGDHEEGTLFDWDDENNRHNHGAGIFNTGSETDAVARAVETHPFSGKFCAQATIHNAFGGNMGAKAVRLMRWTDKPWDQGGGNFPRTAYYGVWIRLDRTYSTQHDNGESGWWNVFQFKSEDENKESQPTWVLNVGSEPTTGKMRFYLFRAIERPVAFQQKKPIPIPVGQWFHVEARYVQSTDGKPNGSVTVWQDGQEILSVEDQKTVLASPPTWGIGNYTDHITGDKKLGSATIYFDDATISTKPLHGHGAVKATDR
jgi:hypothetical protein